jgi:CHASE2 domain-containing sensor protein
MRYGKGRFRLMRKHLDTASLSQLIPALFTAGLVLGGVGSLVSNLVRESLLVMLLAYAALLLGSSAKLGFRHGWQHFVVAPVVYLAIHLGFGVGFWAGAFQTWWETRRPRTASAGALPPRAKTPAAPARCGKEAT